jgi:hypothetical protein
MWQDAAVRWLRDQACMATIEDDKEKLRWLDRHLPDRELESINRALIDAITEAKTAEGCSNATVNRTLGLIRVPAQESYAPCRLLEESHRRRAIEPFPGVRAFERAAKSFARWRPSRWRLDCARRT